jgi:beta-lactamase class A
MKFTRRESLWVLAGGVAAAAGRLDDEWQRIARGTDGMVGAAALDLTSSHIASLNGESRFPLASVCKLPIAIHILAR